MQSIVANELCSSLLKIVINASHAVVRRLTQILGTDVKKLGKLQFPSQRNSRLATEKG